jgi:hypothetical protein
MSTPDQLLTAASAVANIATDEPLIRAAVSRHYYAAYHRGFAFHTRLPLLGSVRGANGKHEQLINQLSYPDAKLPDADKDQSIAVGKLLRFLCGKRVDSDYYLKTPISPRDLKDVADQTQVLFAETK